MTTRTMLVVFSVMLMVAVLTSHAVAADAKAWPDRCTAQEMPAADAGFTGVGAPPASLVEKAVAEGQLVLYSALAQTETVNNIVAEFRKAYPGIAVTWSTAGGGVPRESKFLAEAQAGQPGADVITDENPKFFRGAFDKGFLVSLDDVIAGFSGKWPKDLIWGDKTGLTGVFTFSPFGFAYNTDAVPKDLVPASWEDLTNPRFAGQIEAKDVNYSANVAQHFQFVRTLLGEERFKAFAANLILKPIYTDAAVMAQVLGAGGAWVMPQAQPNVIRAMARKGAPVKFVLPSTVGGTQYGVGVRMHAKHPNAAALFAYWSYSAQGQWVIACSMQSGSPFFPGYGPEKFVPYSATSQQELAELNNIMGIRH